MTQHNMHFSPRFNTRLDELIAAGQFFLLRAQALEDGLAELREEPMLNDGRREGLNEPHWIKVCRATGHIDTGLRIIYLLGADGSVHLVDLYLSEPVWTLHRNRASHTRPYTSRQTSFPAH